MKKHNLLALGLLFLAAPVLAESSDSLEQSWWLKYKKTEQPVRNQSQVTTVTTQTSTDFSNSNQSTNTYFTVPNWNPPTPYVRPQEIITKTPPSFGTSSAPFISSFIQPFASTGYSINPYSYTYPLSTGFAYTGMPPIGAPPFFGASYMGGYFPYSSYPINPFGSYGGISPWINTYSYMTPGTSALMMGAFGGNHSNLGTLESTQVFQSAPSKASGNYYAPSTQDTTASGSYYASSAPAQIPVMQTTKMQSFWGAGGNPFKDINQGH